MASLERTEVQRRPAWDAWIKDALFLTPCEKCEACYAKVNFDDGSTLWIAITGPAAPTSTSPAEASAASAAGPPASDRAQRRRKARAAKRAEASP
jgi:hypothetical protein